MKLQKCLAAVFAFLATVGSPLVSSVHAAKDDALRALNGEWLYVEDRTEGRASEKQGPPMSVKFVLRVEKEAVVHVRPRGDERIPLDGSVIEVAGKGTIKRYHGKWKDGLFWYETDIRNEKDKSRVVLLRREFRITAEGLLVRVIIGDRKRSGAVALYRHPNDIAMPTPAKATMADMKWLAGAWIGKRGTSSIEERWSPPLGGAILGVSRTVSRGRMVAFEYLRIVERDGGLVYIAQPGGKPPTEFVLIEAAKNRAVFVNPRHSYPQRIVYELSKEGALTASIGFAKGGRPRSFSFKRERK